MNQDQYDRMFKELMASLSDAEIEEIKGLYTPPYDDSVIF